MKIKRTATRLMWSFTVLCLLAGGAGGLPGQGDVIPLEPASRFDDESPVDAYSVLSMSSAAAGETYDAATVIDVVPGWHINSAQPHEDWLIPAELTFDTIPGIIPHSISYPEGRDASLAGMLMSVYDGRTIIRFRVAVDENTLPGEYRIPVRLGYQPCDDRQCGAPDVLTMNLRVKVGEEGQLTDTIIFDASASASSAISSGTAQTKPYVQESDLERLVNQHGFWGYFLALGIAFVTGLLLSFSPCTYPMIPITVSIFAGQERSISRGFFLSLIYVGSMAVVYGLLGLLVSLVGGVFGAWLASPPVVIGMAAVFVVFALSMFGLYELNVPMALRQKLGSVKKGGGVVGSLVLGIIAALVVSPCVGPFVAGILLYVATAGSPLIGFLILFVFAVGLGTLFIIIGTFSTAIAKLPGSGEWMESVKKFFGFVLLLMAVYFLQTIISVTLTAVIAGLILLSLGVFGGGLDRLTGEAPMFSRLKKLVGLLALLLGIYLLVGTVLRSGLILPPAAEWLPSGASYDSDAHQELIAWQVDLDTGLEQARREGKPVIIDTWATWCANCRVLDRTVFGNRTVADEIQRFIPLKIQLEKADSPETREFMQRFGLRHYSLPTTLLLDSQGAVLQVMQGVMTPEEMLEALRQIP
ncbi:MAG: thioredoxin family protein [Candidatus Zixiibacteriota bacterium]|nr:MAG: thioredoxin family protein [candidate division Zixibacteria bacterium]